MAATRPDTEFDPKDPKTPAIKNKKFVRLWKIKPGVTAAVELEDRSFMLMVKTDTDPLPPYAAPPYFGRFSERQKGMWLYGGEDLAAPFSEKPQWAAAFTRATGQKAPSKLPYWYEKALVVAGKRPFTMSLDLEHYLEKNGWRKKKDKIWGPRFVKRYGSIWVAISTENSLYSDSITIQPVSVPRGISHGEDWKAFYEATRVHLDIKGKYGKDLDAAIQQVADKIKSLKPARRKKDLSGIEWRGTEGKAALDAWKQAVVKLITDDILEPLTGGYRPRNISMTTQSIVGNILNNYNYDDINISRKYSARLIRAILDKLAKQGRIQKWTGGRSPEWAPLES